MIGKQGWKGVAPPDFLITDLGFLYPEIAEQIILQ